MKNELEVKSWSQGSRVNSLISRSSQVTQALMANAAKVGVGEYKKLQVLESKTVAAGALYETARAALVAAQAKRDEAERDLAALNSTCLVVCRIRGAAAAIFEQFDRDDAVGLASHLEGPVSKIEAIGPMLADLLRHQRKVLARCVGAMEPAAQAANQAFDALSSTLFQLEAGISMARSLLASCGITVKLVGKARNAKKAKTGPEPTAVAATEPLSQPMPTNGATSHEQPPAEPAENIS